MPSQTCRVCGCRSDQPCAGGCYWIEPDLCSSCANVQVAGDDWTVLSELLESTVDVELTLEELLVVHAILALARRDPGLRDRLPGIVLDPVIAELGELLVTAGIRTEAQRDRAEETEPRPRIVLATG